MTSNNYMLGRKKWLRPQAMLWSDTSGTLSNGFYIPSGYETLSNQTGLTTAQKADTFLILSDHNRSDININGQRIEQRKRMINGTLRSVYIADKFSIDVSWTNLPSRSFSTRPDFNQSTGKSTYSDTSGQYTADGGAGGAELLAWYEKHKGPFWVFLSYDKYTNFGSDSAAYTHLAQYSQIVQVYITSFNYTITKRGGTNHDLWNVSVSMEEV